MGRGLRNQQSRTFLRSRPFWQLSAQESGRREANLALGPLAGERNEGAARKQARLTADAHDIVDTNLIPVLAV